MPDTTRIVSPCPHARTVRSTDGALLTVPPDWVLVPPGDAALTRRIRQAGPTWSVQERKGRKTFSHGTWADGAVVQAIQSALAIERATPQYQKKRSADQQRRTRAQENYVDDFRQSVLDYLRFHAAHADLANRLADAVTQHATPVGSGAVARTQRIPIDQRAEAAVIAWMRHQTTAYDSMTIPRVKGQRREIRRMLAKRSHALLDAYRTPGSTPPTRCPLQRALTSPNT